MNDEVIVDYMEMKQILKVWNLYLKFQLNAKHLVNDILSAYLLVI